MSEWSINNPFRNSVTASDASGSQSTSSPPQNLTPAPKTPMVGGSSGAASSRQSDPASTSQVQLPPEEQVPDEDPPPYTPTAQPGQSVTLLSSAPPGFGGTAPRPNLSSRPNTSTSSSALRPPPPTPNRPTSQQYNRPPVQRPPPNHGRPPPTHGRPPRPFSLANLPRPGPPFQYPPGYWCPKCHNTAIKLKNGKTCQDCYARFARQSNNVQFLPNGGPSSVFGPLGSFMGPAWSSPGPAVPVYGGQPYAPGPGGRPRVVRPGDPAIGGILCGRCRGAGLITEFLFEETCPTCRGLGRLL